MGEMSVSHLLSRSSFDRPPLQARGSVCTGVTGRSANGSGREDSEGADWAGIQGCGRALSEGREVNPAHTAGDSGLLCFENRKCVFYLLLFSVLTLSACSRLSSRCV